MVESGGYSFGYISTEMFGVNNRIIGFYIDQWARIAMFRKYFNRALLSEIRDDIGYRIWTLYNIEYAVGSGVDIIIIL
jgi:hypothetical protein